MSTLPDFTGPGYFAGESPDGLTTVAGVPVPADVRVYWRDPADPAAPDVLVAQTASAANGTWRIVGLNPDLQYVVRGRKAGFDDVSVVGAVPTRTDVVTATGSFVTNADKNGVDGSVLIEGGLPPYSIAQIDPLPFGLEPVIAGHELTVTGQAGADDNGLWQSTLRVTASNGPWVDVAVQVEIDVADLLQPSFVAQAFATVLDYFDWNPANIDTDEMAAQRYTHSVAMWARLGVAAPPLVYKQGPKNVLCTIPLTVGEFPVESIVGTQWLVTSSNGGYGTDTQEGLYQFLDADGQEVFALGTYKTGTYASTLRRRIAGGAWSDVPRYSYGNGFTTVTFNSAGAVGVGNYTGSGSAWGGFSASFDATRITTVRCSVQAASSAGAAWTYLELLDANVNA